MEKTGDNEMCLKGAFKKKENNPPDIFVNYNLMKELTENLLTVLQVIPWFIQVVFVLNCLLLLYTVLEIM